MSAQPDYTELAAEVATEQTVQDETVERHLHPVVSDSDTNTQEAHNTETAVDKARRGITWAATTFTPHSGLYSDRQPAIAETVRRAHRGGHLPDSGPLRSAAKGYGYLHAANTALVDTWKWVVAHPARLAVLGVLLTLAVVFPPTRDVLAFLLTPLAWAHDALA